MPIPTFARPNPPKKAVLENKLCRLFFFGVNFFLKNCLFLKIWPRKSGYRHLRRPKSLPRMRFSGLYDASLARNINFCVFDLDLERKTTSPFWSDFFRKQKIDFDVFLKNYLFSKIWPSKSGYSNLRRRNSLRHNIIHFSGLYDASLARNIELSACHLDLGRKTTSPCNSSL